MALWQDLHYGLRLVSKNPGFAAVVAMTLGLGIGINCAMFGVLNSILLRPLPYKNAGKIVELSQSNSRQSVIQQLVVSAPDYLDWKEQNQVFDRMAAWSFQFFDLTGRDEPERVEGFKVTADFFPILGVEAALGRTFLPEEEQSGRDHVVILSDGLWRRRFASDRTIVGRAVTVEGEPYLVVGVLPPDFRLFRVLNGEIDVYVPNVLDHTRAYRWDRSVFVYARLRSGVSLEQARAEMDVISSGIAQRYPDTSAGWRVEVVELRHQWTDQIRTGLLLLQAAVGFVLLIGCANVANLLLARAAGRHREMATRVALGAGRLRLIRQLLAESLVLALLGGALATGLAMLLTSLLNRLPYSVLNRVESFRVDAKVLACSLGITLLTGLAVGLAPTFQCSTQNLKPDGLRQRRLHLLVVSEVGLAVMLLAFAGLLIHSSLLVAGMNRGLNPRNVLTAQIWLPRARYSDGSQVGRFWLQAVERVSALPGVESASAVSFPPLSGLSTDVGVQVEGGSVQYPGKEPRVLYWVIGPRYFETMAIPLLQGRQFTDHDNDEAHGVVIVSAAMAQTFWPGESAVGKRIQPVFSDANYYWLPKSKNHWLVVVGVAGDVRLDGILPKQPEMYLPYAQNPSSIMHLVIRTSGKPSRWAAPVRKEIQALDKDQPVSDMKSLDDVLAESVTRPSVLMRLLATFAGIALVLAALGIYGVVTYFVSRRTQEIGIRVALGARPEQVVRFVMGQGLSAVLMGVAVGVAGGLAGTRVLRSVLVGVTSTDVLTFVAMPAVLIAVAIVASYIPARRAAKMEPMNALRSE